MRNKISNNEYYAQFNRKWKEEQGLLKIYYKKVKKKFFLFGFTYL